MTSMDAMFAITACLGLCMARMICIVSLSGTRRLSMVINHSQWQLITIDSSVNEADMSITQWNIVTIKDGVNNVPNFVMVSQTQHCYECLTHIYNCRVQIYSDTVPESIQLIIVSLKCTINNVFHLILVHWNKKRC